MIEELKKLQKLQKIDSLVFAKEEELDSLPFQNDRLEQKIREMDSKLQELKNSISIQEDERQKRQEILTKGEDKLKNITGKQSAIRNKEEYNALLREIDNIKRFNRELEEEINEINREIEIKQEELNLIQEDNEKKIISYRDEIDGNLKNMEVLENEIDSVYAQREEIAKTIRPAILRKYERILDSSPNGRAIAETESYVCGNCSMTLPPQLFNNVLKSAKIEMCPNCQCILAPKSTEEEAE